jgi:hypothetical protein
LPQHGGHLSLKVVLTLSTNGWFLPFPQREGGSWQSSSRQRGDESALNDGKPSKEQQSFDYDHHLDYSLFRR